ncbi:MAG: peptide deformylase [Xanthomonadales bacterium]|nr:peptide deformylase [Gammaproteobacteria bacterium]MBT8052868.1 peptide deformylase [Gammaproteobacteria bacterium]NND55671.1 peptide deformylase [Xanthomonadales bacterium]NNK49982.1 peptide deformylase [Xanthomonadales bacterium]
MAKLEILEIPDVRLRTIARPVEAFDADLVQLVADMTETMYGAAGIGLAATQVNVHRRLLVLDVSESQDQPRVYINPEIISAEGSETCEEGCLSVPGIYAEVSRAEKVRVSAQNPDGSSFEEDLDGMHAICLQHEIDHLDGKLFVDYLSPLKRRMVTKKLEKQRKISGQKPARAVL